MKNQQGAPEALIDPSPDQLRAIARTARNSSGSASDDCGPLAYVLHGWRAAAIASRAQQAALVEAQQPATHVQNPAEIEHVAGDVSKNGPKSNMAQQPAPSEQQPFGWIKQSEIDSSNDFGGSINLWRQKYDCDVPVYLAQQPAPSAAAALSDDLRDGLVAISEAIADQDDRAAQAMLREILAAPQPSPTPQADSQPAPVATNYKQALGSTNCMQCCVSYMLGVPMANVPDFANDGGWELFSEFVESKGYAAVMFPGNHEFEADYLASGAAERGTQHMVVMNDGKLVHDPHPSNAGLVEVQCVWLLAKKSGPQRHHDERASFEASAKAYTSNVSFERDGDDYEDMTASLLWHGWKLRAARAPADGQPAPVVDKCTKQQMTTEVLRRMQQQEDGHNKNPFRSLLDRLMRNEGGYSTIEIGQLKYALDGFYGAASATADSVTAPAAYSGNLEQELAMLIRRIVSSARRNCEDGSNVLKLANEAWVYLVRKGLNGSPLRDAGIETDPTPPAQAADSVLEDVARLLRQILAASQDGDSDTHLSAHFVSRIETITNPGGAA